MGFLLLWIWCCWSCFLLRALGAHFPAQVYRAYACASACARVCVRVILTQVAVTSDTRIPKPTQIAQKPRPYAPKTVYNYILFIFIYMDTNRAPWTPKTPSNTSSFSAQVLSLCSQ